MGMFCEGSCLTGLSEEEKQGIIRNIRRKIGEPVMGVELVDEQIEECICEALEEYSYHINTWALENRLAEMLGLPNTVDFTLKYVSTSQYFERANTRSHAEELGLGANSTRNLKTAAIILTAGTQDYYIESGREVINILWFSPSFINLYGLDPFANTNIAYSEFGASFAGHTLYQVMPVFDTILTAQAAELRFKVRASQFSYILNGGPNGTKRLRLFPIPNNSQPNDNPFLGIAGGIGTPGTLFYQYYDAIGEAGNPAFSGTNGYTGTSQGNGLVSGPSDAQLNWLTWDGLNSLARTWVKRFAQALAKELLGLGIRGKFSGQLPIPGAELTLNSESLITQGRADMEFWRTRLKEDLAKLNLKALMEERASMQESMNKTMGYTPLGIFLG